MTKIRLQFPPGSFSARLLRHWRRRPAKLRARARQTRPPPVLRDASISILSRDPNLSTWTLLLTLSKWGHGPNILGNDPIF